MKSLIVIITLLLSSLAFAIDEEKVINSAYVAYQRERYDEVLDIMSVAQFQAKRDRALQAYMMGLSYSRVEEFRNALRSFKSALLLGAVQKDIHYEMGQALYAINELKMAKNKFVDSYNTAYKKVPSLYYLGHISQLLDQTDNAKKYFLQVAKNKKADTNLRQISTFQLAEVIFEKFRESNYMIKKVVRRYVLPLLNEAIAVDPKSPLADDIRNRKAEILRTYKLDTIILSNGREISKQRLMLNIGFTEKFDNNVTYAADDISVSTTSKESSIISEGSLYASYNIIPNRSWVITPTVSGTYVSHHQDEPLVYTNDYYQWGFGVGNSIEHLIFDNPASFLLDINYSYKAKDYLASETLEFYEEQYEFSFGERFRFFKSGDTVAKVVYRSSRFYDESLDTVTYGVNLSHTALIMNKHYFITYGAAELETAEDSANESTLYILNGSYYIPSLYKRLDMSLGYTFMMIDTELKGAEMAHIPFMELTQNMGKFFDLKVKIEYTKNLTDDPEYSYSKYIASLGINYNY